MWAVRRPTGLIYLALLPLVFSVVRRELERAVEARHRRMIVIVGLDDKASSARTCEVLGLFREVRGERVGGVYVFQPEYPDANRRQNYVRDCVRSLDMDIEYRPYKDTEQLLGVTLDFAVLDLHNDLKPNDVGRLGGIVRGGGIYVVLVPPLDVWRGRLTKFQQSLLVPQYSPNDVKHRLKERFWRKLLEHEGIVVLSEGGEILRAPGDGQAAKYVARAPRPPNVTVFPQKIYSMAATQDQVNVLRLMEELYEKPGHRKKALVITADRGRGKSAAVGLGLAALAHRLRKLKASAQIVVTAMEYNHVATLLEFVVRGLKALGYRVEVHREGGAVRSVKAKGIYVDYISPYQATKRERADIVAVDEASSIPLPILYAIHERFNRIVFSTTVHGYEGAGRGFSVRFLRYLRESRDTDVAEYEMEEPIRYAPNDPVERWLFDTFLLDAEPARIGEEDLKLVSEGRLTYVRPGEDFYADDERLRQFFGIYVQAHYRNEPDDLGMLLDAPHHTVRALALENGKIVVAVELAEEGGLDDATIDMVVRGVKLPGNIIPDRVVKYWRVDSFARLRGWRIVRIATHPELQDRGLGTTILAHIVEEAAELGLEWVGTGFGVSPRLVRFWVRNGFMPVHLSPERNPTSGEYSALFVKPIGEAARDAVVYSNREFRRRLLLSLMGPYNDVEPETIYYLLWDFGYPIREGETPDLSKAQIDRLVSYGWGPMTYENVTDAMFELARTYFFRSSDARPHFPTLYELALISKVLQAKPWKAAAADLGIRRNTLMVLMRHIARVLLVYFYGKLDIPQFIVSVVKSA